MNVVNPVAHFPFMGYFNSPMKQKNYQTTSKQTGKPKDRKVRAELATYTYHISLQTVTGLDGWSASIE